MVSPETSSFINGLRQRMAQGQEVTDDEMLRAVKALRQDRLSAATASEKKSTARTAKAAALNINGDDLLSEML